MAVTYPQIVQGIVIREPSPTDELHQTAPVLLWMLGIQDDGRRGNVGMARDGLLIDRVVRFGFQNGRAVECRWSAILGTFSVVKSARGTDG